MGVVVVVGAGLGFFLIDSWRWVESRAGYMVFGFDGRTGLGMSAVAACLLLLPGYLVCSWPPLGVWYEDLVRLVKLVVLSVMLFLA